jgi:hypothetical protein
MTPWKLIRRVIHGGTKATSPFNHQMRKQALVITKNSAEEDPPGVQDGGGCLVVLIVAERFLGIFGSPKKPKS